MIRILKFEDNVKNQSKCWNLSAKCQVDQNVEILSEKGRLIKMLKFEWMEGSMKTLKVEDKVGNQSKCWNLSANRQIDQNVEIWVQM